MAVILRRASLHLAQWPLLFLTPNGMFQCEGGGFFTLSGLILLTDERHSHSSVCFARFSQVSLEITKPTNNRVRPRPKKRPLVLGVVLLAGFIRQFFLAAASWVTQLLLFKNKRKPMWNFRDHSATILHCYAFDLTYMYTRQIAHLMKSWARNVVFYNFHSTLSYFIELLIYQIGMNYSTAETAKFLWKSYLGPGYEAGWHVNELACLQLSSYVSGHSFVNISLCLFVCLAGSPCRDPSYQVTGSRLKQADFPT